MHKIVSYKPKQGADLALIVSEEARNITPRIARMLHAAWTEERRLAGDMRAIFQPNESFRFSSGLIFRLYAVDEQPPTLEFLADATHDKRSAVLETIEELLWNAGVDNKAALTKLTAEISAQGPAK